MGFARCFRQVAPKRLAAAVQGGRDDNTPKRGRLAMRRLVRLFSAAVLVAAAPLGSAADLSTPAVSKAASGSKQGTASRATAAAGKVRGDQSAAFAAQPAVSRGGSEGSLGSPGPVLDELSVCLADESDEALSGNSVALAPEAATAGSDSQQGGVEQNDGVASAQSTAQRRTSVLLGLGLVAFGLLSR
jgi:hypothetical protein